MTSKFLSPVVAVVAATLVAGVARADDFDYQIANILLLQSKPVQSDMGVTESQRAKLNKHADDYKAGGKKLYDEAVAAQKKDPKYKPDQAKLEALQTKFKKDLMSELTAKQGVRLREITLQVAGSSALANSMVETKLGFTSAQQATIKKLIDDAGKKSAPIQEKAMKLQRDTGEPIAKAFGHEPKNEEEAKAFRAKMDPAMKKIKPQLDKYKSQIDKIQHDTLLAFVKVLTPAQLAQFKSLQGVPMKKS